VIVPWTIGGFTARPDGESTQPAGDVMCLFSNPLDRLFSRAMHLFPTDSRHPGVALKIATRVLERRQCASLAPRGLGLSGRSLRRFLPGIGQLLLRSGAPALPA
jgi:hypothetical protein